MNLSTTAKNHTMTAGQFSLPTVPSSVRALVPSCMLLLVGCIRITINPQCPDNLEVGQVGALIANEENTGAIATYLWEAVPAGRVDIDDPESAETTFEALRAGQVQFTLTASDGLFQMIDTCTTTIGSSEPELDLEVSLVANPTTVGPNGSTLLTCTSIGNTAVVEFTIDQLDGAFTVITEALPGVSVAEFATATGTYTFRCIGEDADGNESEPATVDVTLTRP